MRKIQGLCLLATMAGMAVLAGSASAQTDPPPPAPVAARSDAGGRGAGPIGFGGVAYLSGATGLSLAYDPGVWHLDTVLLFTSGTPAPNQIVLGARGWYHLHSTSAADFSVGGGLSYSRLDPDQTGAEASNALFVEAAGLIRVFLAQNVALGAAAGLIIGAVDAEGVALGPQNLVGSGSLHYYF
jgi:hypothetical protein